MSNPDTKSNVDHSNYKTSSLVNPESNSRSNSSSSSSSSTSSTSSTSSMSSMSSSSSVAAPSFQMPYYTPQYQTDSKTQYRSPRNAMALYQQNPYNPYVQPYLSNSIYQGYQAPPLSPHYATSPTSYDSIFLTPQSSIFASYLQSIQTPQTGSLQHQNVLPSSNRSKFTQGMISLPAPLMAIPRGPPKKPKQSNFALWVGNLPSNTTLIELCGLFGTSGIQSIFLIQRTLCAFVNYNSQASLDDGIAAFERRGSSIRENKLVIKVKLSSRISTQNYYTDDDPAVKDLAIDDESSNELGSKESSDQYFICKSLTVEDLYASIRLGLWSTQSHNQALFNEAYKVSSFFLLVYPLFSNMI